MTWRRRPPAGFIPPAAPRGRLVPPLLLAANELFAEANYSAASEKYELLATLAENRDGPRAPWFWLQAARSRLLADDVEKAVENFRHGIYKLYQAGLRRLATRATNRAAQELRRHNLDSQAAALEEWSCQDLGLTLVDSPALKNEVLPSGRKALLPVSCASCGGPMRLDEVEWLDAITAVCVYCGTPVRGEEI